MIKSRLFSSARGWRPIHLCRVLTICTGIDVILEASNYLGVDEVAKKMRGRTDVNWEWGIGCIPLSMLALKYLDCGCPGRRQGCRL